MTRHTVDGLLSLEVAELRREGALQPGVATSIRWVLKGEELATIDTRMSDCGDRLELRYTAVNTKTGQQEAIRETIGIYTTPQHLGGARYWLGCPGCMANRGSLYLAAGRFRCRKCFGLAYPSTRQDAWTRAMIRRDRLRLRVGGSGDAMHWYPGDRPRGMHRSTWLRLLDQWQRAEDDARDEFVAEARRILGVP